MHDAAALAALVGELGYPASAAEAWARSHGGAAMRVRSNVVRPEAHAFYGRLGYGRQKTQHCYARALA
jgi:hypothetical protein